MGTIWILGEAIVFYLAATELSDNIRLADVFPGQYNPASSFVADFLLGTILWSILFGASYLLLVIFR